MLRKSPATTHRPSPSLSDPAKKLISKKSLPLTLRKVRLRSKADKLCPPLTISQGFSDQNSPNEVSTLPGALIIADRFQGCDTTAIQTQFHPSGSLRDLLTNPAVAKISNQPS